jgi:hypothetical protein
MKYCVTLCILFGTLGVAAQMKLEPQELTHLVRVSEIYSADTNLRSPDLEDSLKPHRISKLNSLIDTLIVLSKGDGGILAERYLKRHSDDELYLWYVIREIHYNRTNESGPSRSNLEVAKETLSKKIDSRWLLDNYYYRIRSGIAFHFNDADLSGMDLTIDKLGLRDKTERAIFFFNVMEAVGGGRFLVLLSIKNYERILYFANRFPKFNGKEYFHYNEFDYEDFDWIGHEKLESYNTRRLDRYYLTLIAHHRAETEAGNKITADSIRSKSILNEPKYFRFSDNADVLRSIYESAK